ncbi:OprD family outer membrane porin [Marivirga harenae]|uniref:OprD family outer membrane porin n=1 Tax=Marivirga harenae TaxID=2010992 RepID=UPI0026DEA4BF|nr:OprD family outer membrane porin [Marivirga harenae]WKV13890.1 OprD family outer membrane porin [Marivirga harenae]
MKTYSYIIFLLLLPYAITAQNHDQQFESIDSVKHGSFNPNEAHSFHEWFKKGHVSGLFRSNTIQTYRPASQNFSGASGLGGRIYYHSAYWHGLQMGIGGIYTYNVLSTDLSGSDQNPYAPRWERQLFDLEDPKNKHDLDRLEELFIKYRYKDSYVKLGKMLLNTPLVNPQDSRMKPSAFQGIWLDWNEGHRFEINGGFFNKVSPRSTTEWIKINESINLYEHLLNPDSSHHDLNTKGIAIAGGHYIPTEKLSFHSWQYLIENISFITFNQIEYQESKIKLGLQYYYQTAINENHYVEKHHKTHKISGQIKWMEDKWQLSYNQTTNISDYAMKFPSEWGAEPFYTFISRHRIIGLEEVNSRAIKLDVQPFNNWKSLNLGLYAVHSLFEQSKVKNSMTQLSLDIQTHFKGNWKALKLRFLNTYFITDGFEEDSFLFESILHTQFMVNYQF